MNSRKEETLCVLKGAERTWCGESIEDLGCWYSAPKSVADFRGNGTHQVCVECAEQMQRSIN